MHTIKGGDDCDWWDGLSRGTEQWKLIIAQVESWCGAFPGHPISELYITSGGTFIGRPIEQLYSVSTTISGESFTSFLPINSDCPRNCIYPAR